MKKLFSTIALTIFMSSVFAQLQSAKPIRTPDEAKQLIGDIYNKIKSGADFKAMALQYSEDPGSSRNGGELDSITRGMLVPEFENVAFNLKLNEISFPFRTTYGFHIVQLIAINGERRNVRHILVSCKN